MKKVGVWAAAIGVVFLIAGTALFFVGRAQAQEAQRYALNYGADTIADYLGVELDRSPLEDPPPDGSGKQTGGAALAVGGAFLLGIGAPMALRREDAQASPVPTAPRPMGAGAKVVIGMTALLAVSGALIFGGSRLYSHLTAYEPAQDAQHIARVVNADDTAGCWERTSAHRGWFWTCTGGTTVLFWSEAAMGQYLWELREINPNQPLAIGPHWVWLPSDDSQGATHAKRLEELGAKFVSYPTLPDDFEWADPIREVGDPPPPPEAEVD